MFLNKESKMKRCIICLALGFTIGYFGPVVCAKKTGNVVASVMHGTGNAIGSVAR